jgi:hypothetical protein
LPRRVFCTARNDKELESKNYDQVAGQWDCFSFSSFAMTRFAGKNRGQVQKGCHGKEITTLCFLHGS